MKQHITQEQAVELAVAATVLTKYQMLDMKPHELAKSCVHDLCNAAIQSYLDQQAKDLPVLPEPNVPEGDWFERDCYIKSYAQAYGQQCAAHAREVALEEAAELCSDETEDVPLELVAQAIRELKRAGK